MSKLIAVIMGLAGLLMVATGAGMVLSQWSLLSRVVKTDAIVTNTDVVEHRGSKGKRSYEPRVSFQFDVAGTTYRSSRYAPQHREKGSRAWAESVVARHPVGSKVEVWYDPGSPSVAFLWRHCSFRGYMIGLIGFWIIGAAALVPTLTGAISVQAPARPEVQAEGVVVLKPRVSVAARGWTWIGALIAWGLLAVPYAAHYFIVADQPWEEIAYVGAGVTGVLALVALWRTWVYKQVGASVSEALLAVADHPLVVGQPAWAHLEQVARSAVVVEELALNLTCWKSEIKYSGGKQQVVTTAVVDEWVAAIGETAAEPGQALRAELSLMAPPGSPPSSTATAKGWPRYRWSIRVRTRLRSRADYASEFPVMVVEGAPAAMPLEPDGVIDGEAVEEPA
ncbi:MAG: DUF3592 domain-containing protein [Phycisphaeraceae bacterium]|nr:DUF3592 domain-containing protein [Phycisphaeraceae bacterium]